MKYKLTLIASLTLSSIVNAASIITGTVIGVDFGGGSDNDFNDVSGNVTDSPIINTSGDTLTGVLFTTSGIFATNGQADPALPGQPSQFTDANKTDWVLSNTGVTLSMTFAGLDDSLTYDLVIGAADGAVSFDVDTTFSVDGQTLTNEGDVGSTAYVSFSDLSTDGSGNLVITAINANAGSFGGVAALELTAVPEPSTTALLGIGGLALILRRRK